MVLLQTLTSLEILAYNYILRVTCSWQTTLCFLQGPSNVPCKWMSPDNSTVPRLSPRVLSYFSHVPLSKQITTATTEGWKKNKNVEILVSSISDINLTVPRNVICSSYTAEPPSPQRDENSKARKKNLFSCINSHRHLAH